MNRENTELPTYLPSGWAESPRVLILTSTHPLILTFSHPLPPPISKSTHLQIFKSILRHCPHHRVPQDQFHGQQGKPQQQEGSKLLRFAGQHADLQAGGFQLVNLFVDAG
jgi:hypothetical protein